MDLTRRRLVQSLGSTGLILAIANPLACAGLRRAQPAASRQLFPQGVASGDPRPDSVILWTRLAGELIGGDQARVECEVSSDPDFRRLVLRQSATALREDDFTLRIKVLGLAPNSRYYYRFIHENQSPDLIGQTYTAPAEDDDSPVTFAIASCQNYEAGHFVAYRHLLDNLDRDQIRFVLHLGDFIYETLAPKRAARQFPEAADSAQTNLVAQTLEDYRRLYRGYLLDDDLRKLRARLPFICIWDDHEFSNDCWQSHSPYTPDEYPQPDRKIAANRAWFEFIPCDTGDATIDPHDQHMSMSWPGSGSDNRVAIHSLRTFRELNWGSNIALLLTDTRSYRQAHPVPKSVALQHSPYARAMLPEDLITRHDARREQADTAMLGPQQHQWLVDRMSSNPARWQFLATSVPLTSIQLDFDLTRNAIGTEPVILTTDTWAGYATERQSILAAAADSGAKIIALSGDHHMNFISQMPLPDGRGKLTELCVAGVSSPSLHSIMIQFSAMMKFSYPESMRRFNTSLLHGTQAACAGCQPETGEPSPNPGLKFVDSAAYGYSLLTATREQLRLAQVVFAESSVQAGTDAAPSYVLHGQIDADSQKLTLDMSGDSPAGPPMPA